MVPRCYLIIAVLFTTSASTQDSSLLDEELKSFRFKGKPIHPAVVEELITPLADPLPTIVSVEVEGGHRNNKARGTPSSNANGYIEYTDPYTHGSSPNGNGYFCYRHLGRTAEGIHVLKTLSSGGGSGIFMDIIFIRFEWDDAYEQGEYRKRVIMKRVGDFCLGDRDDGTIKLDGNKLTISTSRYRSEPVVLTLR